MEHMISGLMEQKCAEFPNSLKRQILMIPRKRRATIDTGRSGNGE
jgi:hypothetical protein